MASYNIYMQLTVNDVEQVGLEPERNVGHRNVFGMANAPATYIGLRNNSWSARERTTSRWHVDSKSDGRKWEDSGEDLSAGMMRLTSKMPLCPADNQRHV